MILIDDKKTVIAGDAVKVLTEIAAVLDRLISEIAGKTNGPTYEEIYDKFDELMDIVQDIRGTREEFNPEEIVSDGKVQALFKETFFDLIGGTPLSAGGKKRSYKEEAKNESSAEDMLERAMRKLQEQKDNIVKVDTSDSDEPNEPDEPKKKKKKNKNKKNKDK